MKHVLLAIAVSAILAGGMMPGYAQDPITLTVGEFWARLDQTRNLARQAINRSGGARVETLWKMDALWVDVQGVRLSNEQIIPINVSWLLMGDSATDDDLRTLQDRAAALLQFQQDRYGKQPRESMIAVLDDVLQDDRFRYGEGQAAPSEEPASERPSDSEERSSGIAFSPSLAQIILMVIGVIAVTLFASYLIQALQSQSATAATNGDEDDVPPTSEVAQDRAETAMMSGDYRAAIRYLYLASLLLLDERGVIRFNPSLTNIEHLRQITGQTQVRGLLEHIVSIFDRVWYGFAPVDDRLYRHFQQLIDQLHQATKTP